MADTATQPNTITLYAFWEGKLLLLHIPENAEFIDKDGQKKRHRFAGMEEAIGGKLEKGEKADKGAKREGKEEAGLKKLKLYFFREYKFGEHRERINFVFYTILDKEPVIDTRKDPDQEHDRFRWVPIADVPVQLAQKHRSILDDLIREHPELAS